jgi:hypothetical protein
MEKMTNLFSEDKAIQEAEVVTRTLHKRFPDQKGVFTANQYESVNTEMLEKQIRMIRELSTLPVPVYLAGGYASDFLIGDGEGEVSNPHTDIDMLTNKSNADLLTNKLTEMGYSVKRKNVHATEGVGKIYITKTEDIQADFAFIELDENTQEPYLLTSRKGRPIKIFFSKDLFGGNETILEGTPIKLISPRALIQSLLFYAQVWGEPPREKDQNRAKLLCEKYFPNETLDSERFKVRVEEVQV